MKSEPGLHILEKMQVITSNRNISPHGGIVPILKKIKEFRIPQVIRSCMGNRKKQSKYGYADIIIAWMLNNYCGGQKLNHITKYEKSLSIIPDLKLPSHDTLGRVMKKMATEKIIKRGTANRKTESEIESNENRILSNLLVKATKKTGLLKEGLSYTLDMDATFVPTECIDAKPSYHSHTGFYPMVSCIDQLPVYISNRNGNVSPATEIKECLEKTINLLKENKIKIGKTRMDSGSYSLEALKYLNEQKIKFYVGGVKRPATMKLLNEHPQWVPVQFETKNFFWDCEGAIIPFSLANDTNEYRLVVLRTSLEQSKRPAKWVDGGEYAYKIVITNDFKSSIEEVVKFYNQRGTSEHNFHVLKMHNGWKYPPFSYLNQNTVFFIIAALTNNIYQAILKSFAKTLSELRLNSRLNAFIKTFVMVTCEYKNGIYYFGNNGIAYEKIM